MRGTVLYGPGDIRFEDREATRIEEPQDAAIRIAATCVKHHGQITSEITSMVSIRISRFLQPLDHRVGEALRADRHVSAGGASPAPAANPANLHSSRA